jgi:hypothetical protein
MRAQGRSKQCITRLCLVQQGRPQVGGTAVGRPISPDYGNNLLNFISLSDSGPQTTDGGWTVDGGRWTVTGSTGFPARQTCKPAPQADMLHGIIRTSRPARSQVPVPFLRDLPDGARQEVKRGNPLRRPQGRLLPQGLCRKGDGMRPIARVRGRSPGCDESRWHHETPLVLRERASF